MKPPSPQSEPPGIFDQPVINPVLSTITNSSNSMISGIGGTASKDPTTIVLKRSCCPDTCSNSSMLGYQLLHSLFIPIIGVVGISDFCSLIISLQVLWTTKLWFLVQVWVLRLMH